LAGSNIVSFEEVLRGRVEEPPHVLSIEELEERQSSLPLSACHAALDNVSVIYRTKAVRLPLFTRLSAVFPKNRKIVILGHKGSGTEILIELLLRRRAPNKGEVYINSRLSWPASRTDIIEKRLSYRANALFIADVFGLSPSRFVQMVQEFCELSPRQLRDKVSNMPIQYRRRLAFAMLIAGDFDCHIFDSMFRAFPMQFTGAQAAQIEALALSRDFIMTIHTPKHIPPMADLAYILYDGRLYMFEDVSEAARVFMALPVPSSPMVPPQAQETEDDDDDNREEIV
jgi:ABC-type polysaccharide/polyol phosphate transport system ATPase subunit